MALQIGNTEMIGRWAERCYPGQAEGLQVDYHWQHGLGAGFGLNPPGGGGEERALDGLPGDEVEETEQHRAEEEGIADEGGDGVFDMPEGLLF